MSFKFSRWQSQDELADEETSNDLLWLLVPLVIILAWRLYFMKRKKKTRDKKRQDIKCEYPGMDSSFYHLVKKLEHAGFKRRQGETMHSWVTRIDSKISIQNIEQGLSLHYRYRFDPNGLSAQAKNNLDALTNKIMLDFEASLKPN